MNPVGAPYFNFTIPEPTGIVGLVAPETSSLLGLVSRLAPPLVAGNTAIVLASESRPLPAVTLTEVLATSDVPGGVVNLLTGLRRELVPVLAAHEDVDTHRHVGRPAPTSRNRSRSPPRRTSSASCAARPGSTDASSTGLDDRAAQRPEWIAAHLEMKTVWHPIGV